MAFSARTLNRIGILEPRNVASSGDARMHSSVKWKPPTEHRAWDRLRPQSVINRLIVDQFALRPVCAREVSRHAHQPEGSSACSPSSSIYQRFQILLVSTAASYLLHALTFLCLHVARQVRALLRCYLRHMLDS